MFKLVVLSALLAIVAAKPSDIAIEAISAPIVKTAIIHEPAHVEVHEPALAKIGDFIESVPTAVSHQSSTVVHSRANQITPIVAPAVRTYSAPVVKTYAAPIVKTLTGPVIESAPLLNAAGAALVQTPYLRSFDGLTAYGYTYANGAPLLYSAPLGYASGAIYRSF